MARKILIGCNEVPGYGGANTASYKLFEIMQRDGLHVLFLNIVEKEDADYFRYVYGENFGNPKCLANVYNCILNGPVFHPHPELADLINGFSPDLLVGVGYIATFVMKQATPEKRLIFLTAGCNQVQEYIVRKKVEDVIALSKFIHRATGKPTLFHVREKEAVEMSDLIITHSLQTKYMHQYFFSSQIGKMTINRKITIDHDRIGVIQCCR